MSALPKAVQKQIAEANRIADAIRGTPASNETNEEGETTPPVVAGETPADKIEDGWEHRYKVLQGKYNKEVPRLQAQIRDNEGAVNEMRGRLNTTEALLIALGQKGESKPNQEPADNAAPRTVTDQEINEFGPDLYDFIKRVASGIAPANTKGVTDRLRQVEETTSHVVKTVAKSARERLFSTLAGAVPNWAELNEDPSFLEWLDESDPYSGRRRGDLLTEAYGANDSNRVIRFFASFQEENAAATPADGNAARTPARGRSESQQNLSDFVAPGTPKTGPAGAQNESGKRVWSRKEISELYARRNEFIRKGKKVPDSLLKEETDLSKAMKEGRIHS